MSESEETGIHRDRPSPGRRVGRFVGERGFKRYVDRRITDVENFDLHVRAHEDLAELCRTNPVIVASNHLIPSGRVEQNFGFSPDVLVIQSAYKELTGVLLNVIGKVDDGRVRETRLGRFIQSKDPEFRKGAGESMGANIIPLLKNAGSNNQELFQSVSSLLQRNGSVLIFPQGDWFEDFDPERRTYSGMSFFARRSNAIVVPTLITGAHSWEIGRRVDLVFGQR